MAWDRWLRPAIEQNEAHESYVYAFDADDADVIRAFQQYRDDAAALAFLQTAAYRNYLAEVEPLLECPPVVRRALVIWTK